MADILRHDVISLVEGTAVDGLLATCIQHEVDHLDGKLFIDYLSPLKRDRAMKKYEKLKRHG